MNTHFSKETRIEHYKQAIKYYEHWLNDYLKHDTIHGEIGMCYVLAEISYENYRKAPWTFFGDLKKYYPELTEPFTACVEYTINAVKERMDIIKSAIEKAIQP